MWPPLLPPGSACSPESSAVDVAASPIGAVRDRLDTLSLRVNTASAATHWQSPSARAFHDRVEELCRDLGRVDVSVNEIIDLLRQARAEVEARAAVGT